MTSEILIISLAFVGVSALVSMVLKGKLQAYGKIPLNNGMTGHEVVEKMLRENGIYGCQSGLCGRFSFRPL